MFPGIYEFKWDAGHIIFLGIFYAVLAIVASTMARALYRAICDFRAQRVEVVRWHADFEDLPAKDRPCRHELAGEVKSRTCENAFDCRHCKDHPRFVAMREAGELRSLPAGVRAGGFDVPGDRLYHRGHTWVREEEDGTLTVGLDDLGAHLLGRPDDLLLPAIGTRLVANGAAWRAWRNGANVRVLAPVDGEVIATGGPAEGWYLRIRPDADRADMRHLLTAAEARPWMMREAERLQVVVSGDAIGAALADGGVPVDDLSAAIPRERLEDVYGAMFLEP